MNAADLQSLCDRFQVHVLQCDQCDLLVSREGDFFELSFVTRSQPTLCPDGRALLLEIFE